MGSSTILEFISGNELFVSLTPKNLVSEKNREKRVMFQRLGEKERKIKESKELMVLSKTYSIN